MYEKDSSYYWKYCRKVVMLFLMFVLIHKVFFPEEQGNFAPKQSYSEQEKSSHRSGEAQESTIMRSLFDYIKGETK